MKMIICSRCNKEITSLRTIVTKALICYIGLDKQKNPQYKISEIESCSYTGIGEYLCPICHEVLFTSESEAITFLKGE